MSNHLPVLNQYTPPLNPTFSFPKDSEVLDVAGDPWEWQPGYNKAEPTPTNKTLWLESGKDIGKYKAAFIKKYGLNIRPFKESTMMVAPVEWRTGFNDPITEEHIAILATKQGEANEIKNAIGIVNNSIKQTESLLYQVQYNIQTKERLANNTKYMDLADREAPEESGALRTDIVRLKALGEEYGVTLSNLRADGQILNQELAKELKIYKDTAALLNIDDGFAKRLEKEVSSTRLWSGLTGGVGGMVLAGIGLYLLASSRRGATRRTKRTGRGADGLFFRA